MKINKIVLMISLFLILMTVFGNIYAQDSSLPAFKVSNVVTDEKVVLTTKNFPTETSYTVSMGSPDSGDVYTAVAKFNSKNGGSLNVTVKIPEKFRGLNVINLMLKDDKGGKILGNFVNIPLPEPEAEPAVEEPAAEEKPEEPVQEEPITLVNQAPAEEQPAAEEPAAEEPAAEEKPEEPVQEEPITIVNQAPLEEQPAAEEPAAEEQAEEPAQGEPITIVNEAPLEEPAAVIPEEQPAAEEIPVQEYAPLVCNYAVIPSVHIDAVAKDSSVTFTTANFPADSTFSVSMGVYVSTWTPDPIRPNPHRPHHEPRHPQPVNPFAPHPAPHFDPLGFKPEKGDPRPAPKGHYTSSFNGTEVGTFETGNGEPQTLTFEIPASLKGTNPIAIWIQDLGACGFYSYNYFYNNSTSW